MESHNNQLKQKIETLFYISVHTSSKFSLLFTYIPKNASSSLEISTHVCSCTKITNKYRNSLACCILVSPSPRLQHPGREESGPAQAAQKALQGRLLSCSGLRAGAPLQPPAVPVRPGAGGPGGVPEAHRDSGQDLVPEPPVQDETPPDGRRLDGVDPGS